MLCSSCYKINSKGHVYIIEESENIIKLGNTSTTSGRYPIYPEGLNTLLLVYTNDIKESEHQIRKYCCTQFEKINDNVFSINNVNKNKVLCDLLNISLLI